MSLIRVLRTAAATLTQRFYVGETLTDCSGSVAVTVTRLDGSVIHSANATHTGTTGIYTFVVPAQADVDHLDVTWTGTLAGAVVSLTDRVEIVGGFLFGLAQARDSDSSLADQTKYPTAKLWDKRVEVEQELEKLTGWAWVPRFARVVLPGTGTGSITLPHLPVRAIRAVQTRTSPAEAYTTVTDLGPFAASPSGILTRYDGGIFPTGYGSTVVELEHGHDGPPEDLKEMAMRRLRSKLNLGRSGVPDRAASYTTPDGSTYRLSRPSRGATGDDEVDAVYQRYEAPPLGFA